MARWPYNLASYIKARRFVLARDPICTVTPGCTARSTTADHLIPVADLRTMYPPGDIRAHAIATDPRYLRGACLSCNSARGGRMGRGRQRPTRR